MNYTLLLAKNIERKLTLPLGDPIEINIHAIGVIEIKTVCSSKPGQRG